VAYNAQRESRIRQLVSVGLNPDDLEQWMNKRHTLNGNARTKGVACRLSFEDYIFLAADAGISNPSMIGRTAQSFCMGRLGDTGDYEIGNCRFITVRQNQLEKMLNGGSAVGAMKIVGNDWNVGKTHSEEIKTKMSLTRKGVTKTEEHKNNIGKSHKGKIHSDEHREKNSKAQTGKKHSDETKNKMSESRKGNTNRVGKKASEETKAKMRAARAAYELKKKQTKEELDGNGTTDLS
jgi:hypothetical protein